MQKNLAEAKVRLEALLFDFPQLGEDVARLLQELIVIGDAELSLESLMQAIDWLHRVDQLSELALTPAVLSLDVLAELRALFAANWVELGGLPNFVQEQSQLAKLLFNSSAPEKGEKILIVASREGLRIAAELALICIENEIEFEFDFRDPRWQVLLVNQSVIEQEAIHNLADYTIAKYQGVKKMIQIVANPDPALRGQLDDKKWELFQKFLRPVHLRKMRGELFYTLTVLPTEADAVLDGFDYADYLRLFFELCNQPWEEIAKAQSVLVSLFNDAEKVRITNGDGTDVSFDVRGQTFANSVVAKNIPGAEIFSSPRRDGVDGKILAMGKYQEGSSGLIEDMALTFEQGRLVDFSARVGEEALKAFVLLDDDNGEGTRFVGELGIGTNPHLRQHVLNGLLVEKVGGSFHIALGNAYQYNSYCGQDVKVDNGNRSESGVHWDLTTMLRGKDGRIYLDDQLVQVDGDWLAPEFKVLNEGWGAMPVDQQPDWWRQRFPNGY